jgi:pimeloyl-ACP methyl ester carboxylesterase
MMTNQLIRSNNFYLWYETFGKKEDTPILLIQGSGAQGLLWQEHFCEKLAQKGYYVIRYDHRDTGQSSHIDYHKNPYELKDLMEDAKLILDTLELDKVHIVGSSMGGYIAQLLGIYYPEKVLTLTLMMSSLLSISLEHAFLEDRNPFSLPLPTKQFTNSLLEIGPVPQTQAGLVDYMFSVWSAYNGTALPYDSLYWTSLAKIWISRTKNLAASYNHRLAVSASPLNREGELKNLHLPTLIIHGSVDPFFPVEHAYALQKAISSSSLVIVEKMGHLFHDAFIETVLDALVPHLQKHDA